MKTIFLILSFIALLPITVEAADDVRFGSLRFKIDDISQSATLVYDKSYSTLSTVTIPESVTQKEKEYPVTEIGPSAFFNCNILSEITISGNIRKVSAKAFKGCTSLSKIIFSDGDSTIVFEENDALYGCPITDVYLGRDLISRIFSYNTKLCHLEIGESVKHIPGSAFYSCTSLKSIRIPTSVRFIGAQAFYYSGLDSIITPSLASWYEIDFGSTMTFPKTAQLFENNSEIKGISIPEGTTRIGSYQFANNTNITEIYIPNSVKSIGSHAFSDCKNLNSITIPNKVSIIEGYAFHNCTNLLNVELGRGLKLLGEYSFASCSALPEIVLPSSLEYIGEYAFYSCYGLIDIRIPATVKEIGHCAFSHCKHLKTVTIDPSDLPLNMGSYFAFSYTPVCKAIIGRNIIGQPFRGQTSLEIVEFEEGVTSIPPYSFYECYKLSQCALPSSLKEIGEDAFTRCYGLKELGLPDGLNKINQAAFYQCAMESIVVPGSVSDLGGLVFAYTSAQSITLGEGVESIEHSAFNHSLVKYVELPSTLTTIQQACFSNCDSLTRIDSYNPIPPKCASQLYDSFKYSCELHVPQGSKEAYSTAFFWKDFFKIIDDLKPRTASIHTIPDNLEIDIQLSGKTLVNNSQDQVHISVCSPSGTMLYSGMLKKGESTTLPNGIAIVRFRKNTRKYLIK